MPDSLGILWHLFPVHGALEHRIAALGSTAPKGHGRVSHFAMSTILINLCPNTKLWKGLSIQHELLRNVLVGEIYPMGIPWLFKIYWITIKKYLFQNVRILFSTTNSHLSNNYPKVLVTKGAKNCQFWAIDEIFLDDIHNPQTLFPAFPYRRLYFWPLFG